MASFKGMCFLGAPNSHAGPFSKVQVITWEPKALDPRSNYYYALGFCNEEATLTEKPPQSLWSNGR